MHAMASALLEWETIDADQIDDIMAGKPPRPPKDWTPASAKPGGGVPPVDAGQRAGSGLSAMLARSTRDGASAPFFMSDRADVWQTDPLRDRPRAAARDGHRQRHAGFVLRRRRGTRQPARRSPTASGCVARRRRHPRHRRRVDAGRARAGAASRKSSPACCRCSRRRCGSASRSRSTRRKRRGDARRARPRRRHRQRRRTRCERPGALDVVAAHPSCGVCLMHMQGEPRVDAGRAGATTTSSREVARVPARAAARLRGARGRRASASSLDPGIGFGKTPEHNLELLRAPARAARRWAFRCWSAGRASRRSAQLDRPAGRRARWQPAWRRRLLRGRARRAHRPRARRRRDGRRARGLAGALARAESRRPPRQSGRARHSMTQNATSAPTASAARSAARRSRPTSCCAWAMPSGRCCSAGRRTPDRADRQGHAHLRLHDRVRARGRLRLGRRRRAADRPAADARRRLPDAGAAPRPRRGHQRLAQPVRRQRHQVLLGARREAAGRVGARGRGGAGRAGRSGSAPPSSASARRIDDASGRYIEFCKSTFSNDLSLQGPEDRRRCRPRRGLSRRARRLPRARRRGRRDRLQPRRHQHQRRLRRDRAGGAGRRRRAERRRLRHRARRRRRPPADRRRARAASTTATNCSTCIVPTACRTGQAGAGRGRHADDQHRRRAGAARARRRRSSAPRSATATCSRSCSRAAGSSAAKAPGHLLALDKHTTGDGIVSALMVLQAVRRSRPVARRAARRRRRCSRRR